MENNTEQPDLETENKIQEIRDILGNYPGLSNLEDRKACDESLRNHISELAAEFLHLVGSLDAHLAQTPDSPHRAHASEAWRKIETLVDKMQSTPYSYSPFFMFDRVPNSHQKNLIDDDQNILQTAQAIKDLLAPTLTEDSDFDGIIHTTVRLTTQLDAQLEARINTIMEFS